MTTYVYKDIGGTQIEMANVYSMAMELISDIRKCASKPQWVDLLVSTNADNIAAIRADAIQGIFWAKRVDQAIAAAKGIHEPRRDA